MIAVFGTKFKGDTIPFTRVYKFSCANCNKEAMFTRVRGRRFFHIYFLSLFPVGEEIEGIQCGNCRSLYAVPGNWNFDAENQKANIIEQYFKELK